MALWKKSSEIIDYYSHGLEKSLPLTIYCEKVVIFMKLKSPTLILTRTSQFINFINIHFPVR